MHNDIPEAMQTFLNELYLIITHKIPGDDWFYEGCGICGNWLHYCRYHNVPELVVGAGQCWLDYDQFDGKAYPFNGNWATSYMQEKRKGALYENPYRREFIARHYKESHHAK